MAKISVGSAIGAGFGLIARRPLSVLAWGLVPTVLQVTAIALLAPIYVGMWSQMAGAVAAGGSPTPPMMPAQFAGLQGWVQLLNLVQLFVSAMVYCAVFRAVVHPEKSAFAYLRVGMAELFLALLIFGAVIALIIGMVLIMIPVGVLIAVAAAASHGVGGVFAIVPIVIGALLIAMLVFGLRFSLVGPMLVDDGKFHPFESWTLTRGRMGSLLLIALGLFGVFLALEIVILVLLLMVGGAAVAAAGGMAAVGALFQHSPQMVLSHAWPFLAAYAVISVPIAGCALAIAGAPFARVYLDLKLDSSEAFA